SVSVGEKAPDFSDLPGIDNKKHSLKDYKKAKAVVVVFTCNHCPVAQAYEERLVELQKAYQKRGVQFVAICANEEDADTLEKVKNHYLRDAIDAVLAGRASATTETRQFGCGIRYGG